MNMSNTYRYVEVIVPVNLKGTFTYEVPLQLQDQIEIGKRVLVQFGNRKYYAALIYSCFNETNKDYSLKPIVEILDPSPIVIDQQIRLWKWITQYYHCSLGEVYNAALPSGLKLESKTTLSLVNNTSLDLKITDLERDALHWISSEKRLTVDNLNKKLSRTNSYKLVTQLLDKGLIQVGQSRDEKYKKRTSTLLKLAKNYYNSDHLNRLLDVVLKRSHAQRKLLLAFLELSLGDGDIFQDVPKSLLIKKSESSSSVLKELLNKGILIDYEREESRISEYQGKVVPSSDLSENQQKAFDEITTLLPQKRVVLLHGVTSSGKTEIYIKLIEGYLKQNKQILYLLPEIGLTTQLIRRLQKVFGDRVGVYHSKLSSAERVEMWKAVLSFDSDAQDNKYQIILGARSASLLPFRNLGLIIIDEEHENTFKQYDPAPRYHARDMMVVLAHQIQADVLLGTATPSIETYYNAVSGKFGLVTLTKRFNDILMPEIHVANIKTAYHRKSMVANFTPELYSEIKNGLENNEQIILFQNRRGFSPFIECKSCGWVPKCKHCDVSLTYHKYNNTLKCHYCGYTMYKPVHCPTCQSKEIRSKGFGTEKIEDDLKELFPEAKVMRMDLDTTRKRKGYEEILDRFSSGEIDILIGTQMVTKGLDFDHVRVVGVMNADNLLNFPDFRSFERTYHLLAQVSGRAGRRSKQGKVIIQTMNPDHPVIKYVQENDYKSLFLNQIKERELFHYPPFYRLIGLLIKHTDQEAVDYASAMLVHYLRKSFGERVLGPEYPVISRIFRFYQKQAWVKFEKEISITKAKEYMQKVIDHVIELPKCKGIIIIVDVDPMV